MTGGDSACGLLATAVNFHQISLLGERDLSRTEAAGNLATAPIPLAIAAAALSVAEPRIPAVSRTVL